MINKVAQKVYKKLNEYILWISICFALDGIIIIIDTAVTNGYLPPYTIVSFCVNNYNS